MDENNLTEEKKISVVTVCRNAENCLEETILSVLSQNYLGFEYIITDGNSTDGTMEIVRKYERPFAEKGVKYSFQSEPDKGIYDAMNKSLDKASGEWILFMNAGDSFFDDKVLETIFQQDYLDCDFIYGNVVLLENGKYKKAYVGSINDITDQSPICHQGTMTRLETLKKYRFDDTYRLAADYDVMMRMNRDNCVFQKIDCIVAIFGLGGTSSQQSINYLREMNRSRTANGFVCPHKLGYYMARLRRYNAIRRLAKVVLGDGFYSEKRGWFSDKEKAAGHG